LEHTYTECRDGREYTVTILRPVAVERDRLTSVNNPRGTSAWRTVSGHDQRDWR
jgi:hypothetical protein